MLQSCSHIVLKLRYLDELLFYVFLIKLLILLLLLWSLVSLVGTFLLKIEKFFILLNM